MSNDIYQHRQFFEESGQFPDFKTLLIPPLTDEQKEKLFGVRIHGISLEETIEEYKDVLTKDQIKILKNHGKTNP